MVCGAVLVSLSLGEIEPKNSQPAASIRSLAPIAPLDPPYRFPNGQTNVYAVDWHFFNAGTARVKMESAGPQQKVTATADSLGVVNVLYSIHDRFEAYFDPHSFCSQRVAKHSEEGEHKRDTQIRFDYTRHKSVLDEKNLKNGDAKHAENDIPACVSDVVTGFYYLAAQPLEPSHSSLFLINDGGKTTEVKAHVEARERVKVPAGTFQTVRLTAEPTSGSLKGKVKVWVWFTDDTNRTPVQMRAKLGWGTLLFKLQRLEKQ